MSEDTSKGETLVEEAVDKAHQWASELGPFWISVFDQFHGDVREWAEEMGIDPLSYDFKATWFLACKVLKQVVDVMPAHPSMASRLTRMADIVATTGMWGATVERAGQPWSAS